MIHGLPRLWLGIRIPATRPPRLKEEGQVGKFSDLPLSPDARLLTPDELRAAEFHPSDDPPEPKEPWQG